MLGDLGLGDWADLAGGLGALLGTAWGNLLNSWHSATGNIPRPARDPNDKLAPAGYGEARFIRQDDLLAYKIRFENVPDAVAPAHKIIITDTLDEDLDLGTFELAEIAFGDHTITVPAGLDHYEAQIDLSDDGLDLLADIDVTLDKATRELTFTLVGIDPHTGWLPEDIMLGVLYPNDDTGRGDGYLSYTVKSKAEQVVTGTEITNKASIIFDWNDPIDTPLVLNTIDAAIPDDASRVEPLPEEVPTRRFPVSWGGQDDAGGSGIAGYDIYVSTDDGPFVLWLDDTPATTTDFTGEGGHTYAFYSIATDNVGHKERIPQNETPDAQTTSIAPPAYYWDGHGDGNWSDSRWVDADGEPLPAHPDDEFTDAVLRTNTVTVTADRSVFDLTVESGAILIQPGNTLTVNGNAGFTTEGEYVSEVNGTANGLLAAADNVALGGTLSIRPVGAEGAVLGASTELPIITAGGEVSGAFDTVPPEHVPTEGPEGHLGLGVFHRGVTYVGRVNPEDPATSVTAKLFFAQGGDGNGDGFVDVQDINTLVANFGSNPELNTWTDGDTAGGPLGRGDGYVDVQDINILVANFGIAPSPDPGPTATATAMVEDNPAAGESVVSADESQGSLILSPIEEVSPPPVTKLETREKATTIEKVSAHDAVLEEAASRESQNGRISMAKMDWLYDCDQIATTSQPSKKHDPAKEAADMLLATYWE